MAGSIADHYQGDFLYAHRMEKPESLMTAHEAAEILGFHVDTIRTMCRTGQLRCIKKPTPNGGPNGRLRIPATAITEWQRRHTYCPMASPR